MAVDSGFGIMMHNVFGGFDMAVFSFFASLQNDVFNVFAKVFAAMGSSFFFILIWFLCAFLFFFKRARKMSTTVLIGLILTLMINIILLKYGLERMRPYNVLQSNPQFIVWYMAAGHLPESPFCFPSGHTACSTCIATILVVLLWKDYGKKWSPILFVYPFLVGCSRIYAMVHYPTDVIAGFIVGLILAGLTFVIYHLVDLIRIKNPKLALWLEKIDLEKVITKKSGKKIKTSTAVLLIGLVVVVCFAASFVHVLHQTSSNVHICEYKTNKLKCFNEGKQEVIDKYTGKTKHYCEQHAPKDNK